MIWPCSVTPAKAGAQSRLAEPTGIAPVWIPACAGMTGEA
jgi:hypothetical protein